MYGECWFTEKLYFKHGGSQNATLTSNEECHLSRSTPCFGANVYMRYDYVHLDY